MDDLVVKDSSMSPTQIACAVLVPLFWGVQFVVIKVGLTTFPPLFFLGLRFAAVAGILLPFVGRPTRRELGPMIAISVFFGGLNFALFFFGLRQGLASVSAVAYQLSTPFAVLLAWPCLGERPLKRVIIGVVLAFGGVALTAAKEPSASVKIVPTLLVTAAGFAWAVGSVLTKRYGPFEPLRLMAWMSLFTVPQVVATSLVIEHGQLTSLHTAGLTAWLALSYTVLFGAVAGWGLWFWLIARCSMTRLAPFALLQTIFAVVAGVAFLHEPLTPALVAGAVICIVGVATTQSRSFARRRLPRAPRAPVAPIQGECL
jgi:O-acetylserine/cysteine efflux transporter